MDGGTRNVYSNKPVTKPVADAAAAAVIADVAAPPPPAPDAFVENDVAYGPLPKAGIRITRILA